MTALPRPVQEEADGDEQQNGRRPFGAVLITVPDGPGSGLPASSSDGIAAALLDHAVAAGSDDDALMEAEDERPRPLGESFSLWRTTVAVFALAALAAAGYVCLYSGGSGGAGATWRLLEAREEEGEGRGGRRSFLLPLHPKPRRSGGDGRDGAAKNLTAASPPTGNVFPTGLYYTTVSIGNPPRDYFLDVDTGSDITWVQCDTPCRSCAKGAHPAYRPAQSNIVLASDPLCDRVQRNPNECNYDINYADRSSSMGAYVRDSMQLTSEDSERDSIDIVFGCGYDQRGILLDTLENTDGILGLGSRAISLPTQLASRGIISNVFGHCMTTDSSGGGYLFLGDDYIPRWGMTWVPVRNGPADNIRRSQLQHVNHGDQQLNVDGKLTQVIFDSGSTYTYFPHEAYTNLVAALKSASPRFVQDDSDNTLPFCMKADFSVRSVDDLQHFFKPLSLQFEKRFFFSRTFNIRPEDYLTISDKGNVCLRVFDGTAIGYDSVIIIGDAFLRGKLIAYDNDEDQIGWIDSDCTDPSKQSRIPFFLRRVLRNQLL
ncbi:aspartic proteinase Asp1-like [Panicum miliaceum]|uniref:Aspartic proteinase Asp1-like n=1 Tax=Panicum miliaceum TaxID=4540 RepID=A0A3L6PJ10_PANMI|nr:aspartic proteinase Asp1-like [Panicum miliaceum]